MFVGVSVRVNFDALRVSSGLADSDGVFLLLVSDGDLVMVNSSVTVSLIDGSFDWEREGLGECVFCVTV